ncbi:MAG: hypothetical protein RL095_1160 [Verrucomicrobiota bacterium]|jgi:hypothetical protein
MCQIGLLLCHLVITAVTKRHDMPMALGFP